MRRLASVRKYGKSCVDNMHILTMEKDRDEDIREFIYKDK